MSDDRQKIKAEVLECVGKNKPAGDLADRLARYFPDVEAYREGDDLVVKAAERFLVVRRISGDRFRVAENVAVPSTNLLDFGGGVERSLDELLDDIASLAN